MTIDRQRWKDIESIYQAAVDKAEEQRRAYLDQVCADDVELRAEVEALLAVRESQGAGLEVPALELVAQAHKKAAASLEGCRLGPCEVLSLLGKGGMGEVYLARDTRLDRQVALKVLPAEVTQDPERLRRFVREAKAASALEHPNIATIYELGESAGVHYIVMEYVKGESLEARIRKGRLSLGEILDISTQVADALDEAHRQGITHRDIKPANLMLTPQGQVKVLDFGLAKRSPQKKPAGGTETRTESKTTPGLIMGTVQYMSPEQVLGQEVDQRSDLFSLGVVLYQMATGTLPFQGDSSGAIFNAILNQTPPSPVRLNSDLPARLGEIIDKALEKDREVRYQVASEIRADLKRLKRDTDSGRVVAIREGARTTKPRVKWLVGSIAAVLALIALVAGLGFWFFQPKKETSEAPMVPVPFTTFPGFQMFPSFSPDGKEVAFTWNEGAGTTYHIYIEQIGGETPRQLTTGSHEDDSPVWSPDGLFIAFLRDLDPDKSAVMLIPVNGGRERQVAEFQNVGGICWHPGGKWLALACKDSPVEPRAIFLLSLETGEKRRLFSPPKGIGGDGDPAFSPDGRRLAFSRHFEKASEIFVLQLSAELKPEGEPKQLTFGDRMAVSPSWTPDGKELVFVYGSHVHYCSLWRISVSAPDKPRPLSFSGEGSARNPSVSLEKNRLVYNLVSLDYNNWRHWISRTKDNPAPPSRFIYSTQTQDCPQFSPDGKEVAFVSYASGSVEIWISNSDGSNPLQLTHFGGPMLDYPRWSPDGKQIVFSMASRDQTEIFWMPAEGGQSKQLTHTPFNKNKPSYSRDGQWIYFGCNRGDEEQVWKMPVKGGEPLQVTRNGGSDPQESKDGRTVFYLKGYGENSSLCMVPVGGGEETKVLEDVYHGNFEVKERGIYFTSGDYEKASLLYFDLASRRTRLLAPIQGSHVEWGFTVSADEGWFLLTQGEWLRCNLMLVENFK